MMAEGPRIQPDAWDGYVANRERIVAGLVNSPVRNAVVLTGDVHSHWASDVREWPDDPSSRLVTTELVTTSISSRGDASDSRDEIDAVLRYELRRGPLRAAVMSNSSAVGSEHAKWTSYLVYR
jgi:phosphodiesterase/alkaline phosphatase D-like protein